MKYFDKIVYISFAVLFIVGAYLYYTYVYNYSGHVDVELVKVVKKPTNTRKMITAWVIYDSDCLNWYVDCLSLENEKRGILESMDLKKYDYYFSVGKQVLKCDYSAYFTEHGDLICEEDSRIPLDVKSSSLTTDSIYIYKLMTKKNKFRTPGP